MDFLVHLLNTVYLVHYERLRPRLLLWYHGMINVVAQVWCYFFTGYFHTGLWDIWCWNEKSGTSDLFQVFWFRFETSRLDIQQFLCFFLFPFQDVNKGLFWDVNISDASHFLLAFSLFLQQLHFSSDITTILLGTAECILGSVQMSTN